MSAVSKEAKPLDQSHSDTPESSGISAADANSQPATIDIMSADDSPTHAKLDEITLAARIQAEYNQTKAAAPQTPGTPEFTRLQTGGIVPFLKDRTSSIHVRVSSESGEQLFTYRPRLPSLKQKAKYYWHLKTVASTAVTQVPRFWAIRNVNLIPNVGDTFYACARAFDSPLHDEDVMEKATLSGSTAVHVKEFRIQCKEDPEGATGGKKLLKLTFISKMKGATIWGFAGIEREQLKTAAMKSTIPLRLRAKDQKDLPEALVDGLVTIASGFYFKASTKHQKVELDVMVSLDAEIPKAVSWNTEREDFKESFVKALVEQASGYLSRSVYMKTYEHRTPVAFSLRELGWTENTQGAMTPQLGKPFRVVGGPASIFNNVPFLAFSWKPKQLSESEFLNR